MARQKKQLPEPIGGGWYKLADGSKVRGRPAAYKAAGLDPDKDGNRRSDAARQRRRKQTIAERRLLVAGLMTSKVPQRVMAKELDVSLDTIVKDVAAVREQWKVEQTRQIDEYVHQELAALEDDEYRLRLRYQAAIGDAHKNQIYDRILKVMTRRQDLLGIAPPDVRRVAITVEATSEHVVFRAGGSRDEYIAALRAAQGDVIEGRVLKAVN